MRAYPETRRRGQINFIGGPETGADDAGARDSSAAAAAAAAAAAGHHVGEDGALALPGEGEVDCGDVSEVRVVCVVGVLLMCLTRRGDVTQARVMCVGVAIVPLCQSMLCPVS